jgi:hypothetical protein
MSRQSPASPILTPLHASSHPAEFEFVDWTALKVSCQLVPSQPRAPNVYSVLLRVALISAK